MHRFYVNQNQITDQAIRIIGPDVNHIKNVLRMKQGEEIIICDGQGKDCYCIIDRVSENEIIALVQMVKDTATELGTRITLFQGLPKSDKMELIIQKAVELGVYEIVPIMTKRVIVRLDDKKKEAKKLERWQAIAEGAAKQSGRGIIPIIKPVQTYAQAIAYAKTFDKNVIPYENAKGMQNTREIMNGLPKHRTVGVFIGPEGGFEETEIDCAKQAGIDPITLGKRILRTETAGLAVLAMMVLVLDEV
jgi:16S rRNA (uracil1498-N3)-methyltransferase